MALVVSGREAASAVPALVKGLSQPSPEIRAAAAGALGQIGVRARAALPALERLARSRAHDFDSSEAVDAAQQTIAAIEAQ